MKSPRPSKDPNSWDILIFTQTWPKTLCYTWKNNNVEHTCNFPSQKDLWTVHGIWFVIYIYIYIFLIESFFQYTVVMS